MELKEKIKKKNGEDVRSWVLQSNNTEEDISVNEVFEEHGIDEIYECQWSDDDKKYIEASYFNFDSSEFIAIMNTKGYILQVGIIEIQEYIKEFEMFIIVVPGFSIPEEALYYCLQEDDRKMAVINSNGKYIIDPSYDNIYFEEEELIFYAKNSLKESKFSVKGETVD